MEKTVAGEHFVAFQTAEGVQIRATILRLSRDLVVFELYAPETHLHASQVLNEFEILCGNNVRYTGRAVIRQLVKSSSTVVCEASLADSWIDVDFGAMDSLAPQFHKMLGRWQSEYRIASAYKLVVADMQSFLIELRNWLEQIELGIRATPSGDRIELENRIVASLEPAIMRCIDALFEKFESVAATIDPEQEPAHWKYMRRHLHPLVMCSPFAYRTFEKPLGYAGDYEMVSMMTRSPYEGSTLFSKVLNVWFLRQMPAEAHRNRIAFLENCLLTESLRVSRNAKRQGRILNIGCGPATEVHAFFSRHPGVQDPHVTLIDFNEETLRYAREQFRQLGSQLGRSLPLSFEKKSVHAMLKEAGRIVERPPERQFDFVYCAGLFDYLPDVVCQRLLPVFYSWVAPGGLLLITNVDPSNPIKRGMEHLLDWHLIYRGSREVGRWKPEGMPADQFLVIAENTGVNIFVELRKPNVE